MSLDVAETADRLALRELVDAYATAVDGRDADAFASLFAPDGVLAIYEAGAADPAIEYRGAEQLRSVMSLLAAYANTFHLMANHRCEISSRGATGETYCLAHHLTEDDRGAHDTVMLIRYRDAYARIADGWRFRRRDVLRQWTDVHPAEKAPLEV